MASMFSKMNKKKVPCMERGDIWGWHEGVTDGPPAYGITTILVLDINAGKYTCQPLDGPFEGKMYMTQKEFLTAYHSGHIIKKA